MFTCPAEGIYSVVGLVPAGAVMGGGPDPTAPAVVHVTACRDHFQRVRKWLHSVARDDVIACRTDWLMEHWGQVTGLLEDEPVWSLTHTG